jgi:hypothetical protein
VPGVNGLDGVVSFLLLLARKGPVYSAVDPSHLYAVIAA